MVLLKPYTVLKVFFLYYFSSQFASVNPSTSLKNITECGGELTAEAGVILSPNYPHGYTTDVQCEWTITVADEKVVTLSVHSFNVDFTDYVAFYDGDSIRAPVIGEPINTGYWSQTEVANFSIRSSGHQLHVLFHAQAWPSGLGFSASYSAKECHPFTYGRGDECGQPCPCIEDHTLYCDSTTGRCLCKEGWTSDTCAADINECKDPNICTDALSACVNTQGSFECACKAGLVKTSTGQCQDPNLCTQKHCTHACGVISETPRIEKCYCPKGMKPDPRNSQDCVECEPWTYGENCSYTANCVKNNTKFYDRETGLCYCYPNWTAPDCSEDVNECLLDRTPCSGTGQACYNARGSYQCHCRQGFEVFNQTECIACGQLLTSSTGNITSPAYHVYSGLVNKTECSWTIIVVEKHVIALSFLRFDLSYSGHYGSVAVYDGLNSSAPSLGVYSSKSPGVVVSTQNSMHIIRLGSTSYSHGYTTNGFDATYISYECPNFHYGPFCNLKCGCVKNNSASCDNRFGTCRCLPGWTGADCSMDRNECLDNYAVCPEYSECKNTIGGFECVCKAGLLMTFQNICSSPIQNGCQYRNCSHMCAVISTANHLLDEQCYCPIGMKLEGDKCVPCQNWTYGRECQKQCSCLHRTTMECQPVSGQCLCMPGWTGPDCSADINECNAPNACPVYSSCFNLPGNYSCACQKKNGYVNDGQHFCKLKECQYRLNSSSGFFTSPWYPYLYYNNANCTWIISVEKGHIISLIIEDFELEDQKWCAKDYIALYDGSSRNTSRLGKHCKSSAPRLIRSSGNEMMIEFISDAYKTFRGFNISYISHICESFTFGDTCSVPCQCVQNNSRFCDSVSGHCTCKTGWRGDRCQVDVDECQGANICQPNTECHNSPGGYSCNCRLGFQLNMTTGLCAETSDCKVKQCSHSCYLQSGQEVCACPDNLQLSSDDQTCVVPYYPYGYRYGDVVLSSDNKELSINNGTVFVSKPIYISSGVPFGSSERLQTVAHIMTSGAILLGASGFDNLASSPNLQHAFSENQFMIAPYWAEINPDAGYTTYHLYESCGFSESDGAGEDLHHGAGEDLHPQKSNVMRRAARDISEYHGLHGFEAKTVLVVTWVSMEPLVSPSGKVSGGGTNTFQAVLVSGWVKEIDQGRHEFLAAEESSYVIFLYQKGQMNWNSHPDRIINIGVISDNITFLPTTGSHLVGLIDSVQGNTGYLGVFSFKVGSSKGPAALCDRYTCSKANLVSDPVYADEIRQLYKCPCSLARLGHQWQLFEKRGDDQDVYCYAISTAAKARFLHSNRRNKLCCYKWTKPIGGSWREWEESRMRAAYLGAESQHSGHLLINDPWSWSYFNNSEALENVAAHAACCKLPKTSKCQSFYKIFPDTGCSDFVDFVPATALGDPHLITLDGLMYTMNGWGEYILLAVRAENFSLQARTEQIDTDRNNELRATVFTAFSAKEKDFAHFQVELSASKKMMIILINGQNLTKEFYEDPNFALVLGNMTVFKEVAFNTVQVVATFSCGVSMKVNVALNNLEINLLVDKFHHNKTSGLLGNFNGNKLDEFMLPNGSVLPAKISESDVLLLFARQWEVTSSNSIFAYGPNKSYLTYQNANFLPTFFGDEVNTTQLESAVTLCGSKNKACIYDFLVTQDVTFALNTKIVVLRHEMFVEYLANNPPTPTVNREQLDAQGLWLVTQGPTASIQDMDGDSVTIDVFGNIPGAYVNSSMEGVHEPCARNTNVIGFSLQDKNSKSACHSVLYLNGTLDLDSVCLTLYDCELPRGNETARDIKKSSNQAGYCKVNWTEETNTRACRLTHDLPDDSINSGQGCLESYFR